MRRPSPIPCLVAIVFVFLAMLPARALSSRFDQFACGPLVTRGEAPDANARLCALAEAGKLSGLRWPNFTYYREQVREFYGPDFAPAWSGESGPTPQARALIELFQRAEEKGLEPEDYDASRWAARLAKFSSSAPVPAEELARFDLALTISALRYVSHLHHGRVSPAEFEAGLKPASFDAAAFLKRNVAAAADVASAVAEAEPSWPEYRRTLKALRQYLALARQGEDPPVPRGDQDVYPNTAYAGVQQLAAHLRRTGDLPADALIPNPQIYEEPLFSAVKHFEGRNGIEPDGILGPDTYREIDTPMAQRALQLKLALERWRWLSPELGSRFIAVNLPEFRLRAYEDGHPALAMRTVVGEAAGNRTPLFATRIESVVFRPYWNIPLSIERSETIPGLKKEPQYLRKHSMELVNGMGRVVTASQLTPAVLRRLDAGELAVRQQPGPANPLGLIKFVFAGHEAIYLHGTAEPNLFASYRRDFSHGCIRVEDPAALAAWVLNDRSSWTEARIQDAMLGKEFKDAYSIRITKPLPVLILYNTAMVEENGDARFFDDIYGQDKELEKALAASLP